jgi:UDP-4-amino-4,6-dideoxy-N-acetyl-beta-L-altrosamine transaminase
MKSIPYSRQDISHEDIDSVIDVLRSEFLTQGPKVPAFETAIADYCKASFAIVTNSATSALHISCLALGVDKYDIVWTSAISFVASANCALYCGASIDFVDIDPLTYNISLDSLSDKLVSAEKVGKLPKVLIAVHLCGQSCDMEGIFKLSKKYGFKIIEDASHAIGGRYKEKPIGGCHYSDITVFSFHPVKIITTGEGGAAVTNNPDLDIRLRLLRSHGITSSPAKMLNRPKEEIWNYQQIDLGFNYRMTDILAALGLSQIRKLDEFISRRHRVASYYGENISSLPLSLPWQHEDTYSAYHLYPIRIKKNNKKLTQRNIYDTFQSFQINVNLHYIPIYRQPFYEKLGFKLGYCPEAERYYREVISIPMYSSLSDDDLDSVVKVLHQAFDK